MKIALVHDHLAQDGGAEQVLKALTEIFPQAPIFTLVFDRKNANPYFRSQNIKTSFLQKIPLGVRKYQWWLSLMPSAIENHDLREYDLVISSSSSFAKGVITKPGSVHLCYCYTPTRFLWLDSRNYVRDLKVNPLVKSILPLTLRKLRTWDRLAAERVDQFVSVSQAVRERIKKCYRRDSLVIYPPVAVEKFKIASSPGNYFLIGARLVPYKRVDLAVKAFVRLGIPLKVFGIGSEFPGLKKMAQGKKNIEFLGKVSEEEKVELFSRCLAFLHPQEEDFGITAVEAMASGRPVIAFQAGGALETVKEGETGEFFDEQSWEDLADKIIRFQPEKYDSQKIRSHAWQFSAENFKEKIRGLIANLGAL